MNSIEDLKDYFKREEGKHLIIAGTRILLKTTQITENEITLTFIYKGERAIVKLKHETGDLFYLVVKTDFQIGAKYCFFYNDTDKFSDRFMSELTEFLQDVESNNLYLEWE